MSTEQVEAALATLVEIERATELALVEEIEMGDWVLDLDPSADALSSATLVLDRMIHSRVQSSELVGRSWPAPS